MLRAIFAFYLAVSSSLNAAPLKNSDFMKLTNGQRHWWYAGAYTLAGHVVLLEDEAKSQCVWDWFYKEPEKRKNQLEKTFVAYPDHTPTSIVIALLRKDCDVFAK